MTKKQKRGDAVMRATLFVFMCDYLLKKNMYEGYNFFKDVYNTYLQKNVPTEAGSYKEGEFDYLQIY